MPTKLAPGADRVLACQRALQQLRKDWAGKGGKEAADGRASVKFVADKTGLKQQNLSKLELHGAIGIDFADAIAAHFETTVDGLVWWFVKGGKGAVRVGDLLGWGKAVREAIDEYGEAGRRFDLAAEIRLPSAPSRVNKEFADSLATFMHKYGSATHTRLRAQRAGV